MKYSEQFLANVVYLGESWRRDFKKKNIPSSKFFDSMLEILTKKGLTIPQAQNVVEFVYNNIRLAHAQINRMLAENVNNIQEMNQTRESKVAFLKHYYPENSMIDCYVDNKINSLFIDAARSAADSYVKKCLNKFPVEFPKASYYTLWNIYEIYDWETAFLYGIASFILCLANKDNRAACTFSVAVITHSLLGLISKTSLKKMPPKSTLSYLGLSLAGGLVVLLNMKCFLQMLSDRSVLLILTLAVLCLGAIINLFLHSIVELIRFLKSEQNQKIPSLRAVWLRFFRLPKGILPDGNKSSKTEQGASMSVLVIQTGGESTGMNDSLLAIVSQCELLGIKVYGVRNGFRGLAVASAKDDTDDRPIDIIELHTADILHIERTAGAWLTSARCDEWNPKKGSERAKKNHLAAARQMRALNAAALIVIGGNGSFNGGLSFHRDTDIPVIMIPASIDNDLAYTTRTIGFESTVQYGIEECRKIRVSGQSIGRPYIIEVMGRDCGDIAAAIAKAIGAEMLVVPEGKWDINKMAKRLFDLINGGNPCPLFVLSEHSLSGHMTFFNWRKFLNEHKKPGELKIAERDDISEDTDDTELTVFQLAKILRLKCLLLEAQARGMENIDDLTEEVKSRYEIRGNVLTYAQRTANPVDADYILAERLGQTAAMLAGEIITGTLNGCSAIGVNQNQDFLVISGEEAVAVQKDPSENRALFERINGFPME